MACDTNVLVSALIADGPPSRVIEHAVDGRIELIVPAVVVSELERVLKRKLGFDEERWTEVEALVSRIAPERPPLPHRVEAVTGHPADDEILACAVEAGADVLASGDRRHLLPVGEHRGVRIVTPQALLAELAGSK